ncbi:hypothetical protein [Falsiruegeria mediterranea]|uniref:Uncharacterized protein n=1 Tax=Falsiruegeria mediterranea M17 TaxID=1200281 RepID=A0A2R8C2D0_9RHOB|nr:hypothetical protein [Falsiruegeria mediterranea]SPJ26578.1 hypothetical protein TRM7615_00046 [Falsiruegeria mediterranea M17]
MTALDYFAWVVLVVLIITVAGWMGALMVGVFWPLALIWAFAKQQSEAPKPLSSF